MAEELTGNRRGVDRLNHFLIVGTDDIARISLLLLGKWPSC